MCCRTCRFFDKCTVKPIQKTPLEINEETEIAFRKYQIIE